MKKETKFLSLLLLGAVSMGFTACSDDDDNGSSVDNTETLKAVSTDYINNVVYPTYTALATHAQTLETACATLYSNAKNGTMTQSNIDAACEAFKNARMEWERSESFLYGAAEDKDIDPHIDSWPLNQDQVRQFLTNAEMVAGLSGSDPAKFVRENNAKFDTALGFHGMEFVLFRNGANRTLAALQANETATGMSSVTGLNELAFLAAVAADLRDKCFQLEYCWLGSQAPTAHYTWLTTNCSDIPAEDLVSPKGSSYGAGYLACGTSAGLFGSWQAYASNVLEAGCSNICQEVYSQKLGQAYRVATGKGEAEDAGDYIESPYSKRSFIDYQDNIYSIKNSLYGTRTISATSPASNSLLKFMRDAKYDGVETLVSALNEAIASLETAKNSGIAFVDDPGHAQVQNCITKIQNLNDELIKAARWIEKQ